jgi:hypothetical protein
MDGRKLLREAESPTGLRVCALTSEHKKQIVGSIQKAAIGPVIDSLWQFSVRVQ